MASVSVQSKGAYPAFPFAALWGFAQLGRGAVSYVSGFAFGATGFWKRGPTKYTKNLGPHGMIGAYAKTARDALLYWAPVRLGLGFFPNQWFDEWCS